MPVSEHKSVQEYPPPRIIVCAVLGDWIAWDHNRKPETGDCPFGECDCTPVVFNRSLAYNDWGQDAG